MRHTTWIFPLVALLVGTAPSAGQTATAGAFDTLETLRTNLAKQGVARAQFEQSFVPVGFSHGEVETGALALELPRCLRWDYADPNPKSFLLCDLELYSWIPGESSGQLVPLENAEQPGLDLLLLPRARLESLYEASLEGGADGSTLLRFVPTASAPTAIASATITLDPDRSRLLALEWTDREGNRSRFAFSQWGPCADCSRTVTFAPPQDLTWEVRQAPGGNP